MKLRRRVARPVCFRNPFSRFFHAFSAFLCFPACIFRNHGYIIFSFLLRVARWCNGSTSDSGSFSLGSSPGRAATPFHALGTAEFRVPIV